MRFGHVIDLMKPNGEYRFLTWNKLIPFSIALDAAVVSCMDKTLVGMVASAELSQTHLDETEAWDT
jgi:hypothetical protein